MKLIFFKGRSETNDYYTAQLLKAADRQNQPTYVVDYANPITYQSNDFADLLTSGDCAVIVFEDTGLSFEDESGDNIWVKNHIPVYSFLLSYPTDDPDYLFNPASPLTLIIPDQSWEADFKKRFPKIQDYLILPGGGTFEPLQQSDDSPLKYNNRDIEILIIEDCEKNHGTKYPQIEYLNQLGADFFAYCFSEQISRPNVHAKEIIKEYFDSGAETCTHEQLEELLLKHTRLITDTAYRFLRQETVRALDQAGCTVEIYGNNWESPDYIYSERIHLHPAVSPAEANRLTGRAKLSLHFMPGYKQGADIRFFDILRNGALCIATTNDYTNRRFKDGTHIVSLDKANPNQTVTDIKYLLTHESAATKIATKGTAVSDRDSWAQRLSRLLELIA